jgi:lipoprotein-anchoring transpeptidase ErfK/SrfK
MGISRRDFLRLGLFGLATVAMRPWVRWGAMLSDWPQADLLARNATGGMINVYTKPSAESTLVKAVYEDTVFVWLREVVGEAPPGRISRRWVETPDGYVYAPDVQPVRNQPNSPVSSLGQTSMGEGMWAEVTVPYVDLALANPPARSPWLQAVPRPRLYYSQVMWIDDVQTNDTGGLRYHVQDRYGYGDEFWAAAEAFRPLTEEDLAPIHPDVQDKHIVVDSDYQTLSAYENGQEVYFCRVSTGGKYDSAGNPTDKYATPVGDHMVWRKLITVHMSGGTTGAGYDTPGVSWTTLFSGEGIAVHSTFWHNDFGVPRSHGCVNVTPEDAKWVFRWSYPQVAYDPGELSVQWPNGMPVKVVERSA